MSINHIVSIALMSALSLVSFDTQAQKKAASGTKEAVRGEGIKFYSGPWTEALKMAKAQNKPIMMDAYTTWCGPCKMMAAKTFKEKEVAEFYNKNFFNVKFDMEKGDGLMLAKKYKVSAYPTILYIDADGKLIHKAVGYTGGKEFLEEGMNALDPQKSIFAFIDRYKKGDRDTAYLYQLITRTSSVDDSVNKLAVESYTAQLPVEQLAKNGHYFNVLQDNIRGIASPQYMYVRSNRSLFENRYGKERVNEIIYGNAMDEVYAAAKNKDAKAFQEAHQVLNDNADDRLKSHIARADLKYYDAMGLEAKYKRTTFEIADNYAKGDPEMLNELAWNMYEKYPKDQMCMDKAAEWSQKSIKIHETHYILDTYAHVLYAQGKYKEAEKVADRSISLAKEANEDDPSSEELLEKLHKMDK